LTSQRNPASKFSFVCSQTGY